MRLARSSHERIERFLREHLHDPDLALPPLCIHTGPLAKLMTRAMRAGGLTLGRHIFISPQLVRRDVDGRWLVPGWLIAHEAIHVLQFERMGWIKLALSYVSTYGREFIRRRSFGAASRRAAYVSVPEERAAYAAMEAFLRWREAERAERIKSR
ncbi:eCIS core domain-containing protein [Pyrinomonas methylaliphatogenes]|jgi:hypothetical protein|uniref:eCIS core domain-containing protein n=1 Tax=Pyrinomonas methylaliphatogenes TaxID=454194 RepID=A0A0B6X0Z1_9BACT|nr:DUF4157 domain-containing protein [Pyrinomonas methylaliphatogenes]MBX5479334.1 DUF4157 domain-containing protein [Pyrinomonas methylaliphatogenes]CDM66224.1 Domain of unknown function (DUF4157) [Pyrinomonas methylaliphatogenes]